MYFILLTWYKLGFVELFFKRGTLQKSGREVLREGIFEKKIYYFSYILCHSLRFIISHFIVLNLFPRTRQFVETTSRQLLRHSFCGSCSILSYLSVFILLDLCVSFVPPNSQTLLECSDFSIELI